MGAATLLPGFKAGITAGVAAAAAILSTASETGMSAPEFTRAAAAAAQVAATEAARAAGAASTTLRAVAAKALELSMVQSSVESLRQLLEELKQQVSDHPWKMTKGELGVAVGDKVREVMANGGESIMDDLSAPEVLEEMKARLAEMEEITGAKPDKDDDVVDEARRFMDDAFSGGTNIGRMVKPLQLPHSSTPVLHGTSALPPSPPTDSAQVLQTGVIIGISALAAVALVALLVIRRLRATGRPSLQRRQKEAAVQDESV